MKLAVVGLWHLGSVTAACLAKGGHVVVGYDSNKDTIAKLDKGQAPLFEPGLDELISEGQAAKKLSFSSNLQDLSAAEIAWITVDTPVDDQDQADVEFVLNEIKSILPHLQNNCLILISSQIPVGTTRKLQAYAQQTYPQKNFSFACSPENLRLGKAIEVFTKPDRVIVGLEKESDQQRVSTLLQPFSDNIIWMTIESAEMTKHAINAFLATSVTFINEIASLCEKVGADAREVERGLKSEERIGPKAYLRPGGPIAGGTLARDVHYLIQKGQETQLDTPFFSALLASNDAHKQWSCRRMSEILKSLKGKTIAALGLTYKAGTDTLRRSTAVETCEWLSQQGAKVVAYDPVVNSLPQALGKFIDLKSSLIQALTGADAILVATEWPQFTALTVEQLLDVVKEPLIFDASGFLMKRLGNDRRVRYFSVGRQA